MDLKGDLSDRQEEILLFIGWRLAREGIAPTVREVAEHLGFSGPAPAHYHLKVMMEHGWLRRARIGVRGYASRSIVPTPRGQAWLAERGIVVPGVKVSTNELVSAARAMVDAPSPANRQRLAVALAGVVG